MTDSQPIDRVNALPLIARVRTELLRVLESLSDEAWDMPTVCEGWSVRDVAVHILGDDVGILSNMRDGDGQYYEFESWEGLVAFIDAQNDRWVQAGRRISRRLLIDLLRFTGEQVFEVLAALDPDELAGPIGWAGDDPDPRWLHIAREYTEYWMHHQHICEAVGLTSLKGARYMDALLRTFVHALPHTYREVAAPRETIVEVNFTGEGGSRWHLIREAEGWHLAAYVPLRPQATITLSVDAAWRLFSRNRPIETLRPEVRMSGDLLLGEPFMRTMTFIGPDSA